MDDLCDGLAAWDAPVVGAGRAAAARPGFADLALRLAACPAPLRTSVVALLLRWPDRADELADRMDGAEPCLAESLRTLYTAAAALQRLLRTRLSVHGLDRPPIVDRFSAGLGVAPVDDRHGRPALLGLGERSAAAAGAVSDRDREYLQMAELLLWHLDRGKRRATAG